MTSRIESTEAILLEQNKRFSESLLYRKEKEYFENKGINAWLEDVPFYITNNPYIATAYAKLIIHFVRDWIAKHPDAKHHPFYVMELGTGPGCLGFYIMKTLQAMKQVLKMDDIHIIYVMTDIAKANLDYHNQHHALKPYIEKGLLDFAVYDLNKPLPIKLMHSRIELQENTLLNPLTLIANYVFDTINSDAFSVQDGKLYELLVTLKTSAANIRGGLPIDLAKVKLSYEQKEITAAYYHEPILDTLLENYKISLKETSFLFPIGAILGLNHLRKLTNNRFFLITSDKAHTKLESLDALNNPTLTLHGGCFSMMANFHALGEYFKSSSGDYHAQPLRHGLKTCLFTAGIKLDELTETRVTIQQQLDLFSPTDYYNLYRHIVMTADNCKLDTLISYLQFTSFDPLTYSKIHNLILEKIPELDHESIQALESCLHQVAENYYHMPAEDCILFDIGVQFHTLKDYETALRYYLLADTFVSEHFGLSYNLGLCYHYLNNNREAMRYLKRAKRLNPNSLDTQKWIDFLSQATIA